MRDETAISIEQAAADLARLLHEKGLRMVTAESCTGGWVAQALTGVVGSSEWFDRGYVTYSNASKQQMLGVSSDTLEAYGAVSEQTVAEMTAGALANSGVDAALAISGIAGPGGGSEQKPVGTVFFAWQLRGEAAVTSREWFEGDRQGVRRQAVVHALMRLHRLIRDG
jgi:nicotinamide-nucleotide amidase